MPNNMDMHPGFWDQAAAYVRKVTVELQDGTSIPAVEVRPLEMEQTGNRHLSNRQQVAGDPIYLDDTDSKGWWMVTEGRGFKGHRHTVLNGVEHVEPR